ncbi:MAG: hypothetical protein ACFFA3_21180 [Promethearchaeota archaeon]
MNEKIRVNSNCEYCGWKFPLELLNKFKETSDSLLCENCGTEILFEINKTNDMVDTANDIQKKRENLNCRYDVIQEDKKSIARVQFDSEFPDLFKGNLKLVISRLLYPHLQAFRNHKKKEITPEILDDLYEKLSPIMDKKVIAIFLYNLHKLSTTEFYKWLKLLQEKIRVDNHFHNDFIIYLHWMIRKVYIIITKYWKKTKLPKFKRIIRDDLKSFERYLNNLPEDFDINNICDSTDNKLNSQFKINQKKPHISTYSLTAYNTVKKQIKRNNSGKYIYQRLIKVSEYDIDRFINQVRLKSSKIQLENSDNESLSFWIGDSTDVIVRGQPGFSKVSEHPTSYGYKYVVYIIKSRLKPYLDLPYIGYHKGGFYERLRTHIRDTLNSNFNDSVSRYIEKSILLALGKELIPIQGFILKMDLRISYNEIDNLKKIYSWLLNNKGSKNRSSNALYSFLIEDVLKKHFQVKDLEYHKKRTNALASESDKTINYKHKIKGNYVNGTIWPNGLNMVRGGSGGSNLDYDLPLLDYVSLVSLGYKHEEICKILSKVYNRAIKSSTMSTLISREFNSFELLQSRVLKPVIEDLIKSNKNFNFRDIATSVRMDPSTLDNKLKFWFDGNGFNNLKAAVNAGFLDWSKISEFNADVQKGLRGFKKSEWNEWLTKASTKTELEDIANHFGITKDWLISKKFCKKLSYPLIGEEIGLIGELRRKLRQKKVIESLSLAEDPKEVMENYFEIRYKSPSQMARFYENLFKTKLSFEDIIRKYSSNPDKYLAK